MSAADNKEELKRRLGPPDLLQIRLLLRIPPERRVQTMLNMQAVILNTRFARLREMHPEMDKMEMTRLVFSRIYRNG
jgi:predicted amino acid racemase